MRVDRQSADISTESRSTYRPSIGRYIDRLSADISADCRSTYRPRVSTDTRSTDALSTHDPTTQAVCSTHFALYSVHAKRKHFYLVLWFYVNCLNSDHVYFVHPSTDISVDISTDARPICRSICRPTLGRYISRDVSVDILTDISTEISADISADTRPICWLICRPRVVVRQSADMSIDRLPTFRRYLTATCACVHSTGDCSLSRRHNLTLVSDFS